MNKINILVRGGLIQEVRVDSIEVEINVFDLDNDPALGDAWDKETKNQEEYIYDTSYIGD